MLNRFASKSSAKVPKGFTGRKADDLILVLDYAL